MMAKNSAVTTAACHRNAEGSTPRQSTIGGESVAEAVAYCKGQADV